MKEQQRQVLTPDELEHVCATARTNWAEGVVELYKCFGVNLADKDGPKINPTQYAIPSDQWNAIASACGADNDDSDIGRVNHMLDFMNVGPSSYEVTHAVQ